PAENVSVCVPVIETPEHIAAAEVTTRELNAFLPNHDHGRPLPRVLPGGCRCGRTEGCRRGYERDQDSGRFRRHQRLWAGQLVSASDAVPGFVSVPFTAKHPTMNSSWLKIGPAALYWGPRNMAKVWNVTARRPTCQPPTASSTTPTASCSCAAI